MKHPTLFDLPKDSPSRKQRLDAFKREHGIETHYCRGVDYPWLACHMPSAREIASEYDETIATLADAIAKFCRLLDECGALVEANSERQAVEQLCVNLGIKPVDMPSGSDYCRLNNDE